MTATASETRVALPGAVAFATLLMGIAACIHMLQVSEYLADWRPAGVFVAAVAVGQAAYAWVLLHRPTVPVALAGIVGNLAVVSLWIVTRKFGLPMGAAAPEQVYGHDVQAIDPQTAFVTGVPQAIGAFDLTATVLELAVVAALVSVLPAGQHRWAVNALFGLGVALLVVRVAIVG
ncbi:MAG: hypothetical protein QOJ13_3381 [Gaiellales bacterium]|jgi:hypothetical protein|nr:hypothetical protein [Gaiellales bacterium]